MLIHSGTSGPDAARLAIARAQMQMAQEANVHLHVRNFATINSVGAVSLRATLNCDAFALAHSSESHFDRSSFVGLAVISFGFEPSQTAQILPECAI